MEGKTIQGKVVSVYDGDTVKVIFPLNDTLYKWNCRLIGVDTPELRTRCSIEKQYGYKVRDTLRSKILNKVINVICGDLDKYGRLLVTLQCVGEDCSVNQWLIDNDYAFAYDGGTKRSWSEHLSNKSA
jgi:micrococcal nuclease